MALIASAAAAGRAGSVYSVTVSVGRPGAPLGLDLGQVSAGTSRDDGQTPVCCTVLYRDAAQRSRQRDSLWLRASSGWIDLGQRGTKEMINPRSNRPNMSSLQSRLSLVCGCVLSSNTAALITSNCGFNRVTLHLWPSWDQRDDNPPVQLPSSVVSDFS